MAVLKNRCISLLIESCLFMGFLVCRIKRWCYFRVLLYWNSKMQDGHQIARCHLEGYLENILCLTYFHRICKIYLFMSPTLKKWGAYWFRLVRPCVRASVRPCVRPFKKNQARVLKFHIWIPGQNIAYPYFFLSKLSPLAELCPF